MGEYVTVLQANALDLPLENDSVDLIVTSPPYFNLRSYKDNGEHYDGQIGAETTPAEFVDALIEATKEMMRVLKPSGSIWVNLGDSYVGYKNNSSTPRSLDGSKESRKGVKGGANVPPAGRFGIEHLQAPNKSLIGVPWRYALRCVDELGLILREDVVWAKPNGLPESVKDRCARKHEYWFHFTLQPKYYSAIDEIREPHVRLWNETNGGSLTPGAKWADGAGGNHNNRCGYPMPNPLGKLPGSVWVVQTQPLSVPKELGIDHFAAFPMEFPRRIIKGWCPDGGVVLDPFGGTGTTALVASVLGRHGITVDLSADYCRLAEWRVNDPKQREKAKTPLARYGFAKQEK